MRDGIEVFYDGQCPFCSAYTRMLHLQQAVGPVELIDARSGDPRVSALKRSGFDLDCGMVLRRGGQIWHGADAMWMLSTLSEPGGILRTLMRSPRRARLIYPWLRRGRGLVLRILGRQRIG